MIANKFSPPPFLAIHDAEISLRDALKTINLQADAQAKQVYAKQENWHSPAMLAQIGLIAVGVVYSILAYKQWITMGVSLEVTQRAYVNASRIEILAPEATDDLVFARINFVIRNSGKTPARKLLTQVDGEISKEPLGKGVPTDPDQIPRTPYHGMGLPPDTEHRVRFDFTEAHLKSDKVRCGDLYASCWAMISYEDQFGVSHASIEPFYYDPDARTFNRHFIGFKESSRRYHKASGYQWKIRAWCRALKNRLS